jgi:hypothetical protein
MTTKQEYIVNNIINLSLNPLTKDVANYHYRNIIKNTIIKPFLYDTSILQIPRQGIDYSLGGESRKPFEGIQQLYLQQIRNDKNYTSPYFFSIADINKYGLSLKPNETGYILSYVNKQNQKIEYDFFYNGDQFTILNKETCFDKYNTLKTPYVTDISVLPEPMEYTPNTILFNEKFKWNIQNYFNSIYYGIPSKPSKYTNNEKQKIIFNAYYENSTFFKDIKTVHKNVEQHLRQTNVRMRKKITQGCGNYNEI